MANNCVSVVNIHLLSSRKKMALLNRLEFLIKKALQVSIIDHSHPHLIRAEKRVLVC